MSLKTLLAKPFAAYIHKKIVKHSQTAIADQQAIFKKLIDKASQTVFGKDHEFSNIRSYNDFKNAVPVRDYEELKTYIEKIKAGEPDVLWPGKPIYFAKTSGTTSGIKYIRLTRLYFFYVCFQFFIIPHRNRIFEIIV